MPDNSVENKRIEPILKSVTKISQTNLENLNTTCTHF